MKRNLEEGLTLAELLVAVTITALLTVVSASILYAALQTQAYTSDRAAVLKEGVIAMERMTNGLRRATYLHIPNGTGQQRTLLAFSGAVNDDNDHHFGDPLFPRIDEDPPRDASNDGQPGIATLDDDGDGGIDEIDSAFDDDDEDGARNEDPLNPTVYQFDGASTLSEIQYLAGGATATQVLCSAITAFTATYEPISPAKGPRVLVSLTLSYGTGDTLTLEEYVYPRNLIQKSGKRVL